MVNKLRVLALDYGSNRIGLALSDNLGITASAYQVLERSNRDEEILKIKEIITKEKVDEIVVGIPYTFNGKSNAQTNEVIEYIESLRENISLNIATWDERLSTVEAEKTLLEVDLSRNKRKKIVDKVTAAIILEGYLEFKRHRKGK